MGSGGLRGHEKSPHPEEKGSEGAEKVTFVEPRPAKNLYRYESWRMSSTPKRVAYLPRRDSLLDAFAEQGASYE